MNPEACPPCCAIGVAVAPPAMLPEPDGMPPHVSPSIYIYPSIEGRDGHPQLPPPPPPLPRRHGGGAEAAWAAVCRAVRLEEPSCAIGDAVAPPAMLPEPDGMLRLPQGAC